MCVRVCVREMYLDWNLLLEDWASSWWRHQIETFSALVALCAGNSLVTGEFHAQKTVTWSWDVVFDMRLNKREAGDLKRHRAHYDVIIVTMLSFIAAV